MNVALGSMFRNSKNYLDRYFSQVRGLQDALRQRGDSLRLILAEADSDDGTDVEILKHSGEFNMTLVCRDNGSPWFGSVDHPDRWRAISYVCDGILEQVKSTDDLFLYVESDLIWERETMLALLDDLCKIGVDACATMCFHNSNKAIFYDVWGHRKDGQRFHSSPAPYHPGVNGILTQIDSAGSCIAMKGLVARNARFVPPENGIVGFCGDIRGRGWKLWLDPQLAVYHP